MAANPIFQDILRINNNYPVGRSWHKNQEIGKGCFTELVRREREAKSMAFAAEAQTAVDKKRRRRKQEKQSWIDRGVGGAGCSEVVVVVKFS